MKVLWFEVTTPSKFENSGVVYAGWQDSLENIVRNRPEIELTISFVSKSDQTNPKTVDGIQYIPMCLNFSLWEKFQNYYTWETYAKKVEREMQNVVKSVNPDIIHVFGTEWLFGLIAKFTNKPVVIHLMGAIVPYVNAYYPPNISHRDVLLPKKPLNFLRRYFAKKKLESWKNCELMVWDNVYNYMGRTNWDRAVSSVMHPGRNYYIVQEALRPIFIETNHKWKYKKSDKLYLISTGCSSFWKGPDMLLKTAYLLTKQKVNFEWIVVGHMPDNIKNTVEKKLGYKFEDNHIRFVGYKPAEELIKLLIETTIYVHTAYIENSPNSICEAQILGVPIVSTNVGGIPSLIGGYGELVPANDPWQMSNTIIELSQDKDKMQFYSENGRIVAIKRHDNNSICHDLLYSYKSIIENNLNHI